MRICLLILFCFVFDFTGYGQNRSREALLVRSDSLFAKGVELYQEEKYDEAIPLFTESNKIDKAELDSTSNRREYSAMWLGSCYYKLGNIEKAVEFSPDFYSYPPIDRRLTIVSDSLSARAVSLMVENKYEIAISCLKKSAEIEQSIIGDNHIWYGNTLYNIAFYHAQAGNFQEAIKISEKCLAIQKDAFERGNPIYIYGLNFFANCYSNQGDYAHALALGTEILHAIETRMGKECLDYSIALNNVASFNAYLGNYKEAIGLGDESLQLIERLIGKENATYLSVLNNVAFYNSELGHYIEAWKLGKEVLSLSEAMIGKETSDYSLYLSNMASYNFYLDNYKDAIRMEKDALQIREKIIGKDHPDYIMSLNNLANMYASLGDYSEAIRIGTEVLQRRESLLGIEHPDYAVAMSNLSSYYTLIGNYSEAIRLGKKALQIREEILGKNHPDCAYTLSNLAENYADLGNYVEAISLSLEALKIREEVLGKSHPDYALSLNNIAGYYRDLGNYAKAIHFITEALRIYKEVTGKESMAYATTLANLASYYSDSGNSVEAVDLMKEALSIYEKTLGKENLRYSLLLNNLAVDLSDLGKIEEATLLNEEVLQIREKILGSHHPTTIGSLHNLSCVYFLKSDFGRASCYALKATQRYLQQILSTFTHLVSQERSFYWHKYGNWFTQELPIYAYYIHSDSLIAASYDGALLSKGLLLNADTEVRQLIQKSGDSILLEKYDEIRMNQQILNKLYEKPISERFLNADSLERVNKDLEQELMNKSKAYGDYTRNLNIRWQNVQRKLGKQDIAIEFLEFPVGNDSIMYVALTLKQGMKCPKMIPLFEKKQLMQIDKKLLYDTPTLSQIVWQPLAEELKGVRNVYFSPAGELHNIAIESLPSSDSTFIAERLNVYRLSSTRQLVVEEKPREIREAVLYGGLDYYANENELLAANKSYPNTFRSFGEQPVQIDSLFLRGNISELQGAKREVEEINQMLCDTEITSSLFTGIKGTEESFKAHSGQQIGLLHISTHGFYWTESEAKQFKNFRFLMLNRDNSSKYIEDKSLTRSGLLFSGAGTALQKGASSNLEDGILTAKELSSLDLGGVDLVVLSACQTGLGEITGDGVFGLQRGFKKAGAKSLLMSLWKVDDKATQILMTRFYKNLIDGKSKIDALREAQRYLQEYEEEVEANRVDFLYPPENVNSQLEHMNALKAQKQKVYSSPYYWAAFVLLDGI